MSVWLVCIVLVSCAGVWVSHIIYKWRHSREEIMTTETEVVADASNRTPYGLRKRAAHQRVKTDL